MGVVAGAVVVVAVVSEVDLAAVAEFVVFEEIFVAFETIDINAKLLCQILFEVLYLPSNMI